MGAWSSRNANRLGLLLDCTHVGKRAALEIIAHSAGPVIFSHSNPSRIVPNPRNIDDEQIAACTARGGIIGLVAWGPLVMRPGTTHWPTLDEFVAIVEDTASRLGGTTQIGLATDMSLGTYPKHEADPWGEPGYPNIAEDYGRHVTPDQRSHRRALDGFHDYPQVVDLANRLLAKGFTDTDVRGVLGENYLRLFAQVWK